MSWSRDLSLREEMKGVGKRLMEREELEQGFYSEEGGG